MKIMGMGIDYTTKGLLIEPMEEKNFSERLLRSLGQRIPAMHGLTMRTTVGTAFREEVERPPMVDLGDPRRAGWSFLVNTDDPKKDEIIETLRPLAEHRGMDDPSSPFLFDTEDPDDWQEWLEFNYSPLLTLRLPHYVMIVGGPDMVPFHFQSLFDSAASVGRVAFDSIDDLKTYVEKAIRLEKASSPVVDRRAIVFATDHGVNASGMLDPTYFSHHQMAMPLADRIEEQHGLATTRIMEADATKVNLENALAGTRPALVYTASHGIGAPNEDLSVQKRFNGAVCCEDGLFTADDVPMDRPFLEGSVFFQFACFGYGTPAESDFDHWIGDPSLNSEEDFVAALPKRLLAHPNGPIAYIGHTDTAWMHGFTDPADPFIEEIWHPRMSPFVGAVDTLLRVTPAGRSMVQMNKRYDIGNALLTNAIDRLQRGAVPDLTTFHSRLANAFITRSDAQNYMILGDPAARLRIPRPA